MGWGTQNLEWEEEDTPPRTVSPAALLKLHRVGRSLPTEDQAKAIRGVREREDTRFFSK